MHANTDKCVINSNCIALLRVFQLKTIKTANEHKV